MPSTRELRRRIKSIKSTRQITKAMELVSASKMRRASLAVVASRPYAERTWEAIQDLAGDSLGEISHPLLRKNGSKKALVIAMASSRGLAGAYDANVIKSCLGLEKEYQARGIETEFIALGRKMVSGLSARKLHVVQAYPTIPDRPAASDLLPIAQFATQAFLKAEYGEVRMAYTHFRSLLLQEATERQIIPLIAPTTASKHYQFTCEPDPTSVLDDILPRMIENLLFQAALESSASEHSARRIAMKNATDNAGTIIDDLTLTYNGVRQGAITQELAEIAGGVAALE